MVSAGASFGQEIRETGALPASAVVTIFRSRLRAGAEPEYQPLARRMEAIARTMPGFVDFKTFSSADGERVSVVVFSDAGSHAAWRDHPEHREAQRAGRDRLYSSYHIAVCTLATERRFSSPQA